LAAGVTAKAEDYLGPCAVAASKDGRLLFVANADSRQVMWVALPDGLVTRRLDVPAEPTGLVVGPEARGCSSLARRRAARCW